MAGACLLERLACLLLAVVATHSGVCGGLRFLVAITGWVRKHADGLHESCPPALPNFAAPAGATTRRAPETRSAGERLHQLACGCRLQLLPAEAAAGQEPVLACEHSRAQLSPPAFRTRSGEPNMQCIGNFGSKVCARRPSKWAPQCGWGAPGELARLFSCTAMLCGLRSTGRVVSTGPQLQDRSAHRCTAAYPAHLPSGLMLTTRCCFRALAVCVQAPQACRLSHRPMTACSRAASSSR